jgi:hypothetical protein
MKKFLSILSLIIFCNFSLFGSIPDIGLGIKSGVNFNQISAKGFKNNFNTNLMLGLYSHVNSKKWGLQYEIILSSAKAVVDTTFKGLYSQYLQNSIDSIKKGSFGIPQLQIPILINYKLHNRFWLQGGLMYTSNISVIDKNDFVQSNINIFKGNDASLVIGAWVKLALRVNASARIIKGLSNWNELSAANNWKNNNIQLSIGYGF